MRSLVKIVAGAIDALRARISGQYRPERHYMRGPGPMTRAKQRAARNRPAGR